MTVSVIQIGARHNYAIPRMLHAEGIFGELMTDSCGMPSLTARMSGFSALLSNRLNRLMARIPVGIPQDQIRTSWRTTFLEFLALRGVTKDHWDLDGPIYRSFESACFRYGLEKADTLYAMQFESSPAFLKLARARGQKLILDVYITPLWHRIVSAEREKFPDWEGGGAILRPALETRFKEQAEVVDILLCPSESVARDVREVTPDYSHKIRVVPYGCGASFDGRINEGRKGRVLFAGSVGLRKGVPYLAEAASLLRARGRNYEFVVAGGDAGGGSSLPVCKDLNFIGRLPRAEMLEEFLNADMMVFPSLAEGCAGSVHEALLSRLPVITTASAGSILKDGVGGMIVPERDAAALADAIEEVVENRQLRQSLADSTAEYAPLLDEAAWRRNLRGAIDELATMPR